MLSGKHLEFAREVALGKAPHEAYLVAYPASGKEAAYKGGQRLSRNVQISEEVNRIRKEAEIAAGGGVMELTEAMLILTKMARGDALEHTRTVKKPVVPADDLGLFEGKIPELEEKTFEVPKRSDRIKAIELLGKLKGDWFAEDRQADASAGLSDSLSDVLGDVLGFLPGAEKEGGE